VKIRTVNVEGEKRLRVTAEMELPGKVSAGRLQDAIGRGMDALTDALDDVGLGPVHPVVTFDYVYAHTEGEGRG
jgi:hypothetical protein